MKSDVAISLQSVSKVFGGESNSPGEQGSELGDPFFRSMALKEMSLEIKKGEGFAVIGRNGAGKSTLLKIMAGVLEPSTGSVETDGRIAPVLTLFAGLKPQLSGLENIYLQAAILGQDESDTNRKIDEILAFADIGKAIDRPLKTYSNGMRARIAFATNFHLDPDILIVDEALAVGDPAFQRKCFQKITELREEGITFVMAAHGLAPILNCERVLLLDEGEPLCILPPRAAFSSLKLLLNATEDDRSRFREEIRTLDGSLESDKLSLSQMPRGSSAHYDPELKSESAKESSPLGARINRVEILDENQDQVNILQPSQSYQVRVGVFIFDPTYEVSVRIVVKDVGGRELATAASHKSGGGEDCLFVDEIAWFAINLNNIFSSGAFFVDIITSGKVDGKILALHTIYDGLVFRVESDLQDYNGLIDLTG